MTENNYLSQSAYAKSLGLSSTAIMKIRDQLDWVTIPGKKKPHVDPKGPKTLKFEAIRAKKKIDDPDLFKATRAASKRKKDNPPPIDQPAEKYEAEKYNDDDDDDGNTDLKKEKIRLQNEKLQLEIDQKRGNLIEKALITDIFNKLGAVDENQIKTLNVTVCPKMSAIYVEGYSEITEEILKAVGREDDIELRIKINKIQNTSEQARIRKMTQVMEDDTGKILKNIWRIMDKDLTIREKSDKK